MMKRIATLFAAIGFMALAGCSQQVPPGFKGKIIGPTGYDAAVLKPGKHWVGFRENMILLDTSTNTIREQLTMKTSDDLELTFDLRVRSRIGGSDSIINAMFDDIRAENDAVGFGKVYQTYLRPTVRSKAREIISQYKIEDVNQNYARINAELSKAIREAARAMPVQVDAVSLGDIQYPKTIVEAINLQKQRELDIARIEAEKLADIKRKEAELITAKKQAEIDLVRAATLRDQNAIVAKGLSPLLLEYRRLEVQEKMADQLGSSGSVVFYPYGAEGSTGLQNRIYQK